MPIHFVMSGDISLHSQDLYELWLEEKIDAGRDTCKICSKTNKQDGGGSPNKSHRGMKHIHHDETVWDAHGCNTSTNYYTNNINTIQVHTSCSNTREITVCVYVGALSHEPQSVLRPTSDLFLLEM